MENSKQSDRYVGTWILVPELCLYEEGEPPLLGRYKIEQQSNEVQISVWWKSKDGTELETEFGGSNDGTKIPADYPGVSHLSITRISEFILD